MMCRDTENIQTVPVLTAHVIGWFIDLNNSRDYIIIAGMGGGGCIPKALGFQEIESWARVTGNGPTRWELSALRAMDQAWRSAYDQKQSGKSSSGMQHQAVGDYCKGVEIENCKKTFGAALERVCATCPN